MRPFVIVGAAVAFIVAGMLALACAPLFPRAVFTYRRHPDFPRTAFLSGKLGVLQPGYARSYLVIAYRYLNGAPLSAIERQQVRDYWKDRQSGDWDRTSIDWVARWDATRARVPGGTAPKRNAAGKGQYGFNSDTNSFSLNCADDAFRTAAQTLEDRARRFGWNSEAVRSWRDAQDAVFTNCEEEGSIPPAAGADLPALIRADRDYQIAAAHFYHGDYDEAEQRFRGIAADARSPWSALAPYLVVRTLSRAVTLSPSEKEKAESAAREVLDNPKLSALHGMTRVLLHRTVLHVADEDYFHRLARDIVSRQERSLREEVWDYTTLYDRFAQYDSWERPFPQPDAAMAELFSRDDLSDWIFTFQRRDAAGARHALSRWRATRSPAWLVCALRHASAGGPGVADMVQAASRIDPASPAFEMAAFHRLRLMIDSGEKPAARTELDRLLQNPVPRSSANLFRSLRMRSAPDLNEFLSFALRRPVMLTTDGNQGETPHKDEWEDSFVAHARGHQFLDLDSIKILNERTPMRLLRQAALGDSVGEYQRRDFVLSSFTRALVLDDFENGLPLAAKLTALGADPEGYLEKYRSGADSEERRFGGIFYVLHHPESRPYLSSGIGRMGRPGRIDDYRDNWWCPVDIKVELDARSSMSDEGLGLAERQNPDAPQWSAAFLSDKDREEARAELKRLAATGAGPDYLIEQTMRFARAHPQDARVPEALHFALRSQRYGCVVEATAARGEAAWKYLWRRYPRDPWTRKTNYPFEAENIPQPGRK